MLFRSKEEKEREAKKKGKQEAKDTTFQEKERIGKAGKKRRLQKGTPVGVREKRKRRRRKKRSSQTRTTSKSKRKQR